MTSVSHTKAGTTLAGFNYTRDNAGMLASTSSTGVGPANEAYNYDALNQLTRAGASTFGYDKADNITKLGSGATQSFDDAGQLTTQSGVHTTNFNFDAKGNRIHTDSPQATYSYDQANRLTQADFTSTQQQPALNIGKGGVAAGASHSLSIDDHQQVWAWGQNFYGQLGNATTQDTSIPALVPGLSSVTAVAGGGFHSLAATSSGSVWAWGANYNGQLGNGANVDKPVAVPIVGFTGAAEVAAGYDHSLARKTDGTIWAWGTKTSGQLGDGSNAKPGPPDK